MPFYLHRDVKRHECGVIVGKDVVFISVRQDGIVDLNDLRAQGQHSKVAQLWLKHIDMQFGCEGFQLVDLLRWSVTSPFPHLGRKTFPMQVVWNIGRALEKFMLVNLSAQEVGEVNGLRLACESSPSASPRCRHSSLPVPVCQRTSAVAVSASSPSSKQVLLERNNNHHEEKPVLELSQVPAKHREANLHVRSLTADAHHKFTVFLFDASCCGSSAYWSIKELLASLGIERILPYIARQYRAWYRAGLQYELNDLETICRGDTNMMKHKAGCTELIILLLARWSFRHKVGGGFSDQKDRSACECFLRTLCKALHEDQTIKMPFCLHRDVKRHECEGIVGKDVVFLSVRQDGAVDLSQLRARSPSSKVAQLWLKHLDMQFGCEDIHLVDLLQWSVTSAFPHQGRATFPMQVVWNIGRALDKFILVNLTAEGVGEVSGLRLECKLSPNAPSTVTPSSSTPWSPILQMNKAKQAQAADKPAERGTKRSRPAALIETKNSKEHATKRPAQKRAQPKYPRYQD